MDHQRVTVNYSTTGERMYCSLNVWCFLMDSLIVNGRDMGLNEQQKDRAGT
jgi:hypothetical protein